MSEPKPGQRERPLRRRGGERLSNLHVLGVNYRSATADTRCAVSFQDDAAFRLLQRILELGCSEALVLSTCNRTELYFCGTGFEPVLTALTELSEVHHQTLEEASYRLTGQHAVTHLFKVASGLDSAVLGEHEILGQLKRAHALAKQAQTVSGMLDRLVQKSFRVGKRVRSESELSRGVTSVASVALRKAAKLAGGLEGKKILIIGAGQIAERVAKSVSHAKQSVGFVCNRTADRASRLAELYGLQTWDFQDLEGGLAMADVIISAVGSPVPMLDLTRIANVRQGQGTVVVDLGVPPNVGASDGQPGIQLLEMEAIIGTCRKSSEARTAAIPKANQIVAEEVAEFERESLEREASPYIGALSQAAEGVRKKNLDWAFAQFPSAGAKERKLLEDLSIRIVRGMLESPIQALKNDLREPEERAVVARLFAPEALQE